MVSTLDLCKYFPDHIKHLLSDLSHECEIVSILTTYIPYLASDASLYYIYLGFGYSPEHGGFLTAPNATELISYIIKEYNPSMPELEENNSKIISNIKKEFLNSFYAYDLQDLTDPAELDLIE